MVTKQLNIKNRTYYLYNDLINIKDFDSRLLQLDKKTSMNLGIYYIGYVTKKPEYEVDSVNPLYLMINRIDGFIEDKNGDKYLNIASTDRNSEVLKKYSEVWNGIKDCTEKINNSELGEYDKDYMKIKSNSDDDIPLNKQLNFPTITVIIRNIFQKDGKYYPQSFLDECLYEVSKCYKMKELIFQRELMLVKQISQ